MTEKELKEHYQKQIENTDSAFQKNILQAEMEHQIKMLRQGITPELNNEDDCLFCGS